MNSKTNQNSFGNYSKQFEFKTIRFVGTINEQFRAGLCFGQDIANTRNETMQIESTECKKEKDLGTLGTLFF